MPLTGRQRQRTRLVFLHAVQQEEALSLTDFGPTPPAGCRGALPLAKDAGHICLINTPRVIQQLEKHAPPNNPRLPPTYGRLATQHNYVCQYMRGSAPAQRQATPGIHLGVTSSLGLRRLGWIIDRQWVLVSETNKGEIGGLTDRSMTACFMAGRLGIVIRIRLYPYHTSWF